ncbi:hypothetical protein R3P38DRAFT_2822664 [Favolaschia claudopus]|uniref:Uncharacterized protein n=1 Tax=Favolaschia claudopus TaxID=2862362 RepID=A0AAW0EJ78_9AGAR
MAQMNLCFKRFPLLSFSRYASSSAASAAHFQSSVPAHANSNPERPKRKKRSQPKEKHPPDILAKSKLQEHLNQLAETNGQLVLADIERCRPSGHAAPGSAVYETEYNNLFKRLSDSFTVRQLRHFAKLYAISLPSTTTKPEFVGAIMSGWGWPSLASIQEKQKDAEPSVETILLNPTSAFLVLGKDGLDSRALSMKHHARLTYLTNPLALRVEGPLGSIKAIQEHVTNLNASIAEDVFELPVEKSIRNDLLQRISRLSGAFTQTFGQNSVRISFHKSDPRAALVAKRLAARAVCEENDSRQKQLLFHLPPLPPNPDPVAASASFPNDYALYPFLSMQSLPWTVNAGGVFRVRRVEDFHGSSTAEDLVKTGGLLMGRGRMFDLQRQEMSLRTLLSAGYSSSPNTSRVVTASIGHVLVASPPGKLSIAPPEPLQGQWKLPYFLSWMEKQSEPTIFNPTLPPVLLESQSVETKMLHRLIYHAVKPEVPGARQIIQVEFVLPRSIRESAALPNSYENDLVSEEQAVRQPFRPTCLVGRKVDVDVMIPDRPTDIRFSIFDHMALADEQWPAAVADYISSLRSYLLYQDPNSPQPEPPLTTVHQDDTYVLYSSSTVRQSVEVSQTNTPATVRMHTESALDLESDQKLASCEIICEDVVSESSWKQFLQRCDSASTISTLNAPLSTPVAPELDLSTEYI